MAFYKNVASQKIAVFAVDEVGAPKTGDASHITAQLSKDGGACAPTNAATPTELDATNAKGIYLFPLLPAETNADLILLSAVSATAGVTIRPVITYTEPVVRQADICQMLSVALTEGAAGRLAAALVKLLDVATPVLTVACVNQGGDAYADAHEALTRLPDATPGGAGGLPTVDLSNYLAGVLALGAQAKLDVNAELDGALNTAIPGTPTADSINERLAAIDLLDDAAGGLADLHSDVGTAAGDAAAAHGAIDALVTTVGVAGAGLTAVRAGLAQTGADSDTLETLSDQIDAIPEVVVVTVEPSVQP
jgi:hypothetical protein